MSKVAKYLNEHMLGEAMTDRAIRERYSTDASVLTITPEMVIYPRVTNDIRKVARFAWQLAEKGHVLPLTVRGGGTDDTGAAIGQGAVIALAPHMSKIQEYDAKQKLLRVQPGATVAAVQAALSLYGTTVPGLEASSGTETIGGAIGYNTASALSHRYGPVGESVSQLEVVLASGDVLQTDRISKRELNKRKGRPGFEGDIYRKLDGLIDDNKQLIDEALGDNTDTAGYSSLAQVKRKDGSFDLAPLIAGSQGTLGIISEMILKSAFVSNHRATAILTFASGDSARDAAEQIIKLEPSFLDYFDVDYFEHALKEGKHYSWYDEAKQAGDVETVVIVGFDDFSKRSRGKGIKKLSKIAKQYGAQLTSAEDEAASALGASRDVAQFRSVSSSEAEVSTPPLFDGVYVPFARFEDFSKAVTTLSKKHHVSLPLMARPLDGIICTRPQLELKKVGDKQKIFKLLDEYATIVKAHGGNFISQTNEGRFKATVAHKQLDDDVQELFRQVKDIFDPLGILNPGVKQPGDLREQVKQLRSSYQA